MIHERFPKLFIGILESTNVHFTFKNSLNCSKTNDIIHSDRSVMVRMIKKRWILITYSFIGFWPIKATNWKWEIPLQKWFRKYFRHATASLIDELVSSIKIPWFLSPLLNRFEYLRLCPFPVTLTSHQKRNFGTLEGFEKSVAVTSQGWRKRCEIIKR